MKASVMIALKAVTIDLDMKDINGVEIMTVGDVQKILLNNRGYIDGDRRQIVIWCKK